MVATRWGAKEEDEFEEEGRGRSKRKREVRTFDVMALELLELSDLQSKNLPVTPGLKKSLHDARTTRAKAARRRHIRHLAGCLRDSPAEVLAIQNFLRGDTYVAVQGDEETRDLEALRSGICNAQSMESTLEEAYGVLPHLDLDLLRKLARHYQQEEDEKSFRNVFRELRRAADESELDVENSDL